MKYIEHLEQKIELLEAQLQTRSDHHGGGGADNPWLRTNNIAHAMKVIFLSSHFTSVNSSNFCQFASKVYDLALLTQIDIRNYHLLQIFKIKIHTQVLNTFMSRCSCLWGEVGKKKDL